MRVALAQVDGTLGDVDANAAKARDVIADAGAQGADVVVFPELSLTGYSLGAVARDCSMPADDPRLLALADAAGAGAVVVGFHEKGTGKGFNSVGWFERGACRHVQRKLYLPDYGRWHEPDQFEAGRTLPAFDTGAGRVAVLVCNDAWQVPLPFLAVQDGAEVLVVPACSARSRDPGLLDIEGCWRRLVRFYAQMLQCYVVFVNRVGTEDDFDFWGGSAVVGPDGEVVAAAPEGAEALVLADVDVADVRRRRREVPLLRDGRLDVLSEELARVAASSGAVPPSSSSSSSSSAVERRR